MEPRRLPPLDGWVAGVVELPLFPGAPEVALKISVESPAPGQRRVGFRLEGRGISAEGAARLDARGNGEWNLESATVDLGTWSGPLSRRLAPTVAATIAGRLRITGSGTLREGVPEGLADILVAGASYDDPARKLSVSGVGLNLRARLADLPEIRTDAGQVLTWEGGSYDQLPLGPGRVEFRVGAGSIEVEDARLRVLGGELAVARAKVALGAASFSVAAQLRGVQLENLVPLLPPFLASARGRLDGRIELAGDAEGLRVESGRLALRGGEAAELRFRPSPGIISARLPEVMRRHYPGLVRMETGQLPLVAETLEITVNAAADEEGRTAVVSLAGGSSDPVLRAPVVLEVNVRGPLDEVVAFGTRSRLRFGGGR